MKKKVLFALITLGSITSLVSVNPFTAKSSESAGGHGATCYESNMYFCRYCSGGALNKKQVTLCTDGISVE